MKNQKVLVVNSVNRPPQEEIDEVLSRLSDDWTIVDVQTTMAPWGSWTLEAACAANRNLDPIDVVEGRSKHLYYCTTIVLKRG